MRIRGATVDDLFGYARHELDFELDEPTIITAPNGAGKTHILMLLRAALAPDIESLLSLPFGRLLISFEDDKVLVVNREVANAPGLEASVSFHLEVAGKTLGIPLEITESDLDSFESRVPSHVKQVSRDVWVDIRTGRQMNRSRLEKRFFASGGALSEKLAASPEIADFLKNVSVELIDTRRLDIGDGESRVDPDYSSGLFHDHRQTHSKIETYVDRLRREVNEARRDSIRATQSADLSFARRALDTANDQVKEEDLHTRYNDTVQKYEALAENALAIGEEPPDFPEKTTPTVRRILNVFLNDWDKRLEPLIPLNNKIQTLREILDSKLGASGKTTRMSPRGRLEFAFLGGNRVKVNSLSSGEQHLVALFTSLLFSAEEGSVVLIDEPEISLHAVWKHSFVDDITRIAKIRAQQVILASHSSAIINGRWDLTRELELTAPPKVEDGSGYVVDDEEVDEFDS